jgi:hypothetical protein
MVNRVSGRRLAVEAGQDKNCRGVGEKRRPAPAASLFIGSAHLSGRRPIYQISLICRLLIWRNVIGRMALS